MTSFKECYYGDCQITVFTCHLCGFKGCENCKDWFWCMLCVSCNLWNDRFVCPDCYSFFGPFEYQGPYNDHGLSDKSPKRHEVIMLRILKTKVTSRISVFPNEIVQIIESFIV